MGSFWRSKNGLGHQTCPRIGPRGVFPVSHSPFWRPFGVIFLLIFGPWGHFGGAMDSFLESKNGLGHQTCPKTAPRGATTFSRASFWRHFGAIFSHFLHFLAKKRGSEICPFFLRFWGLPERSTGWAHMQSVHAGAVQTHFFSCTFSEKRLSRVFILSQCWM